MSLLVDGDEVGSMCAFFHLLQLYRQTIILNSDSADTEQLKLEAWTLFMDAVKPMLLSRLLRSLDPALTDAATGNNALHETLSRLFPKSPGQWAYELTEALIQRGVDIHQRNKQGRTAALSHAAVVGSWGKSACALHLLLQHGADINAQDKEGDTVLHHLVRSRAIKVLEDFFDGEVSALDLFVFNRVGQTPADLAAIQHAENPDGDNRHQTHQLIRAQTQVWQSRIRPAVLRFLSEPLIPDVAKLVLGYVDGSGRAFAAAEEAPDAAAADHE